MNDPNDFTPKERYIISLYKDPAKLFRISLGRTLAFVVPSICFIVAWFFDAQLSYLFVAWGILLVFNITRTAQLKRGLGTTKSIIEKYEAKLQAMNR